MSTFKAYVAGKRVALVGPASTLHGTGSGPMIDAHDIVVRINHAWPLPKKHVQDIGSRIDVLYHNLRPSAQRITRRDVLGMRRDGMRWMISTHPASERRFRYRLRRFRKINKGTLGFRAISGSLKRRMQKSVRHPNAGIMAIEDLLHFPLQHLYVTGFSFYTTGYMAYPAYKKSFAKWAVRHHSQAQNKTYLARLIAREKRLEVDPVMARLLQEHMRKRLRRK